jgi:hypothetical protein
MHIRTHISLLLAISIAGAFALAVGIGSSLWTVASRTEQVNETAADLRRVEAFVLCSHDLMRSLSPAMIEGRPALSPMVERCRENLTSLHMSNLLAEDPVLQRVTVSFEAIANCTAPALEPGPDVAACYLGAAAEYGLRLGELMDLASIRAHGAQGALATYRRNSAWILGGLTVLYLVSVLSAYGWTVRRLVSPIERLTREVEAAAGDPVALLDPGAKRSR